MTIASFLGMVAGLLTRLAFYATWFTGGDREGNNQNTAMIEIGIMVVSAVVYAISFVLIRALSRYRELAADRSGAILIGRPALLKSALIKITGEMGRIPTKDIRSASAFNAFYFTPAIKPNQISIGSIFSTHPSLEKRLAQLDELERQLGTAE